MHLVDYNPFDLIEAEYNPRQLNIDQHAQLTDSIKRFGLIDPLIINVNKERKNILIGGHQRLKIAKELGIEKVPCVELDLSAEKEKELNVRLNKNTGSWDWDALSSYFDVEELTEWGFSDDVLFETEESFEEEISEPKASDDGYSRFELIMLHENKLKLLEALNKAKNEFALEKQEDALMEIINRYFIT
jgi:hypothetical protein